MARRSSKRDYERGDRVGELIRRILAEEIEGLDDDRLHLLSFTGVEVDNELNVAKVYWSCFEVTMKFCFFETSILSRGWLSCLLLVI